MKPHHDITADQTELTYLAEVIKKTGIASNEPRKIVVIDGASEEFLHTFVEALRSIDLLSRCWIVTRADRIIDRKVNSGFFEQLSSSIGSEGQIHFDHTLRNRIKKERFEVAFFLAVGDKRRISDLSSFRVRAKRKLFVFEIGLEPRVISARRYQASLLLLVCEHAVDATLAIAGLLLLIGYCLPFKLARLLRWS